MQAQVAENYLHPLRQAITQAYRKDEEEVVVELLSRITLNGNDKERITSLASNLVQQVRDDSSKQSGLDAFLVRYDLSTTEGIALMCMAEALLRIPDKATVDKLIQDKISMADWQSHLKQSDSAFVNAATWALMLTGRFLSQEDVQPKSLKNTIRNLAVRSGEPVIRKAVVYAMKVLGQQFVMGQHIQEALKRAKELEAKGFSYSYDMLGEEACTADDAERYFDDYQAAIDAIGKVANGKGPFRGPGISVKLSALHPRYEFSQREYVVKLVAEKLFQLALLAKQHDISFIVDAEEASRLDLTLDVIEMVFSRDKLAGWKGFGVAVQSYQKRAIAVIDWLAALSKKVGRRIMVRLIKGAYWDSEIKESQVLGLVGYPVFTRKSSTDVSFIACASHILSLPDAFYPMFATHNAHTIATILQLAKDKNDYEFQCLHGMGQDIYDKIINEMGRPCRIYAPVGSHEDLLAYLVRRLLENGANTSFVNRIADKKSSISDIVADPIAKVAHLSHKPHPHIPLPKDIYLGARLNSSGLDLSSMDTIVSLYQQMQHTAKSKWQAASIVAGEGLTGKFVSVYNPADNREIIGEVAQASEQDVASAVHIAQIAHINWSRLSIDKRAQCLERAADLIEQSSAKFMAILIKEAGKTVPDALAEVREAVDFCRYYAATARNSLGSVQLTGPTGELNQLSYHGRGVTVCISPWNFPLAIFIGQISAALVAGNCVIAKPAEQTPIIAMRAIELLHQAGVHQDALQLLVGSGSLIGAKLIEHPDIAAVMFTGSTQTASIINQSLASKQVPIIPFIAETGGINAMIVDSSALPEQVTRDVMTSAFSSAGQRCSALRVLFIQDDVADRMINMIIGAMAELQAGDPASLATDIGPVIDQDARDVLEQHISKMKQEAQLLFQLPHPDKASSGYYVMPAVFLLKSISQLKREVFGPILHIVRFHRNDLERIIEEINQTGYGLTLGIHSRVNHTIQSILAKVKVGNVYVNRNMIGAVVGVQPFGGEGLSGTGPKAGGPNYLHRLCTERCISVDTTAAGGNASLVSLAEDDV